MIKKKAQAALLLVFIIILVILTVVLIAGEVGKSNAPESQKALKPEIFTTQAEEWEVSGESIATTSTEAKAKVPEELMDFDSLKETIPNVVAWLTINGTTIDYPIMQGADNDFYINHGAEGNSSKAGALFLDYRCQGDFSGVNSIIYGHNLKSGNMFGNLKNFKNKDFFDSHITGTLYTPKKTYYLEIFAVCVTNSNGFPYQWSFTSLNQKHEFLTTIKQKAMFFRETDANRILTLSTCSYEFTDARTVLFAKIN